MKKDDLWKIYAFAGAVWTSFKLPTTDFEARLFDEVWYSILQPYDEELIFTAIQEYATENDFCNIAKIGALCKKYTEIKNGTFMDEDIVLEHICNAVSWDKCKENFAKLNDFEKEIVGGAHILARWSRDESFNTVILSNLRKKVRSKLQLRLHENLLNLNYNNVKVLNFGDVK